MAWHRGGIMAKYGGSAIISSMAAKISKGEITAAA